MHFVIFYFSGTGNTWWVSSELKKDLEGLGESCEIYSLENPILNDDFVVRKINESEHIIVGFPVYGSDMPRNIREFIKNLPEVSSSKKFSSFCTQASFSGDASVYFKKLIEEKGYKFYQSFQVKFTTNFNVAMFPFSLSRPARGKKLRKRKEKAARKVVKMAWKIYEEKKYFEGKWIYQVILGHIQRIIFRKCEKNLAGNFKFLKEKCTRCRLCVENCPAKCITLDDSNGLVLKRDGECILCFRCYNFCPQNAIYFGKKIRNPEKYIRYKGPLEKICISDISQNRIEKR